MKLFRICFMLPAILVGCMSYAMKMHVVYNNEIPLNKEKIDSSIFIFGSTLQPKRYKEFVDYTVKLCQFINTKNNTYQNLEKTVKPKSKAFDCDIFFDNKKFTGQIKNNIKPELFALVSNQSLYKYIVTTLITKEVLNEDRVTVTPGLMDLFVNYAIDTSCLQRNVAALLQSIPDNGILIHTLLPSYFENVKNALDTNNCALFVEQLVSYYQKLYKSSNETLNKNITIIINIPSSNDLLHKDNESVLTTLMNAYGKNLTFTFTDIQQRNSIDELIKSFTDKNYNVLFMPFKGIKNNKDRALFTPYLNTQFSEELPFTIFSDNPGRLCTLYKTIESLKENDTLQKEKTV